MKIEMCESLFSSWLRHVKGCRLVQTNWKPSPTWKVENREKSEEFMKKAGEHFQKKYGYEIFKGNSFSQLISQAEADLVGICFGDEGIQVISVETAFHKAGFIYKDNEESVTRIIKKWVRSALCIAEYFNVLQGEIIFASPKIYNGVINNLNACAQELNNLFAENGLGFNASVIANEDFRNEVLLPVMDVSDRVNDTTELFMRSYQLVGMFENVQHIKRRSARIEAPVISDEYGNLKIGLLAKTVLGPMLENGAASAEEVELMQKKDYSKVTFGLDFPLLARCDSDYDKVRYYKTPLLIYGIKYMLCSQWFETSSNNDRQYLLMWIETHKGKIKYEGNDENIEK